MVANIPWKNILEESIVIQINDLELDLVIQSREELENVLDSLTKSECNNSRSEKDQDDTVSFFRQTVRKIMMNMQL